MNESPLWTAVAADGSVEDVRIMDLDVAKTTWSRVHESMRVVHLRLSRQPDLQWIKFFHEERESRIGIRRRGLWIEDGYVAFDCLTDEIESHHLPDIRRSLDFANLKYREFVAARQRERSDGVDAGRVEQRKLEALRIRLRESFGTTHTAAAKQPHATAPRPAAVAPDVQTPIAAPVLATPVPVDPQVVARHDTDVAAEAASAAPSVPASLEDTMAAYRDSLRAARQRGTADDTDGQS
jgi:hypothetical protein